MHNSICFDSEFTPKKSGEVGDEISSIQKLAHFDRELTLICVQKSQYLLLLNKYPPLKFSKSMLKKGGVIIKH